MLVLVAWGLRTVDLAAVMEFLAESVHTLVWVAVAVLVASVVREIRARVSPVDREVATHPIVELVALGFLVKVSLAAVVVDHTQTLAEAVVVLVLLVELAQLTLVALVVLVLLTASRGFLSLALAVVAVPVIPQARGLVVLVVQVVVVLVQARARLVLMVALILVVVEAGQLVRLLRVAETAATAVLVL